MTASDNWWGSSDASWGQGFAESSKEWQSSPATKKVVKRFKASKDAAQSKFVAAGVIPQPKTPDNLAENVVSIEKLYPWDVKAAGNEVADGGKGPAHGLFPGEG